MHATALVPGQGKPGEVLEAANGRLVVAAGDGAVALKILQVAGKKPQSASEFLRGRRVEPGDRMGGVNLS